MKALLWVLLSVLVTPAVQAAPPSAASIHQLFEATHASSMLDTYIDDLDAGMQAGLHAALRGQQPSAKQQQIIDDLRAKTVAAVKEALSWEKLEPTMTDIYRRTFTQREVNDMLKFYRSPSGRAVVDKVPRTMQEGGAAVEAMLPAVLDKLQQIQRDAIAQLKAAGTP